MTAKRAGRAAYEGLWATLKKLMDQWVLLVFLSGALFWARDTYDEFAQLPPLVRQQVSGLAALDATVTRLQAQVERGLDNGHLAAPDLSGAGQDAAGTPVDAGMAELEGQWFALVASAAPVSVSEGETVRAFGVRVHLRMGQGRARASVRVARDCGGGRQVEAVPWLQLCVLDR